jgi:hypothetical protein
MKEFYTFYSSSCIVGMIKSRKMGEILTKHGRKKIFKKNGSKILWGETTLEGLG